MLDIANRAICVHISDIVIEVGSFLQFFHRKLDLCVSLAVPDNSLSSLLTVTGVSHACVEIGLGKLHVPCAFLEKIYREGADSSQPLIPSPIAG